MRIGSGLSGIDLTAQQNLLQAFTQLSQSSVRLATMQRINSGADDPAGLIAAEELRAEITAIRAASDNAARARGMIRVADSAMSEVSGLLNTIRGNLVSAAGGGLSDAETAALQMENDAALEAINRIGGSTSFGSQSLLDGSAGFHVSGVNAAQVTDIQVYANAGGGTQTPNIEVTQAAEAATLTFSDADATLDADVTLALTGTEGTVTLEFAAGTTFDQVSAAVNTSSDSTGVAASAAGGDLTFSSTAVGSDATVSIEVLDGAFYAGDASAAGTDVVASVDGAEFTGQGNRLEISTATLQADIEFAQGFTGEVDPITISGDAMTFVFSPRVGNTSTLALPNISTSTLGRGADRLGDLASGGSASLASGNFAQAMDVLDAARGQVLGARTRAGAFERYTIEASERVLGSMEVNLSSAFSQIFDTDVAAETSNAIRAQILVQAATSSVMLAGQSRGMMAGLLQTAFA
ncbi:MAG: hypothetical protein JXB62_02495 [Pirellulales bacterium]|nr:hypothetical protein [Pirellulales bacterium]